MTYPSYKLHLLSVDDTDCMIISYQHSALSARKIAGIDAGNVGDSKCIKNEYVVKNSDECC